ncbi:MAG: cytochrome c, partial [Rhizobiaceae bacterium]
MTNRTVLRFSLPRVLAATAMASVLGAALPVEAEEADIEHGRALVETNCARCHGIGADDRSAHPDAPEFRTLSKRYPVDALEEAFAEGIVTGHPDMPEFEATPKQ